MKGSSCSPPLLIKVLSLLELDASTSLAPFDKTPAHRSLTSPSCWPGSHHFTHFPKYHNYMYPVIWNKCWQTCQSNIHASKQGQVQISTDYSQRTVGFQLNRSTGPQLSISIGHSSQLSLLPYQTWRSYYEMTLIVVSNLPHLFTSGRWHWGSRGRRKERIGRKFVPKAAWQDNNRQNWRLVALTGRGVGGYTITTLGIRSQELYRDETNSPTK